MLREPWFRIIEVIELHGRSVADIVHGVVAKHGVTVTDIRGQRQNKGIRRARTEAMQAVASERPDLSSGQAAIFFRRDSSSIRHLWRRMGR
jgi:chromosomal replication initiation ATPase DnaA